MLSAIKHDFNTTLTHTTLKQKLLAHRNRSEMNKDENKAHQVHTRTLHTTKPHLREVTSIIDDGLLNGQLVVDLLGEKSGK